MTTIARRLVSKKKRRHQDKELAVDLDLTYITPRIIAMGFPSIGKEGLYRNRMSDVKKFLDTRHPCKYRIYNLCSEKTYSQSEFFQVERFPFDDHQAPPFEIMLPFCRSVEEWTQSDPENVVVVHCKAGKGRTGVMICAYLIYSGMQPNDDAAMDFYAEARTYNKEGVTIRSQRRYIRYFYTYLKNNCQYPYPGQTLYLEKIVINNPPRSMPSIMYKVKDRDGKNIIVCKKKSSTRERSVIILPGDPSKPLRGDFKFSFREFIPLLRGRGQKEVFRFWINTFFVDGTYMRIPKMEIDGAYKDKRFDIDFSVDLHFTHGFDSSSSSIRLLGRNGSSASSSASRSQMMNSGSVEDGVIDIGDQNDEDYSSETTECTSSGDYDSTSHSGEISDPDQLLEDLEEEYRTHDLG